MPRTVVCGACAGVEGGVAEGWKFAEGVGGVRLVAAGWRIGGGGDEEDLGDWRFGLALAGAGVWHSVGAESVGWGVGGGGVGVYHENGKEVVGKGWLKEVVWVSGEGA